jgi:Na+/H+ antiporter NhaD/arsenite permease-like protein
MLPVLLVACAHAVPTEIPLWLMLPFGLLLLLIAIMPLTPLNLKHWWEHNYPAVSVGLGVLVSVYYYLRIPGGGGLIVHTVYEYVSFITLIGSLFVVAGGIHLKVKGGATPLANVAFLAIGAVAANFIGTTGASMVLIRPWIRMNKVRISAFHVVFSSSSCRTSAARSPRSATRLSSSATCTAYRFSGCWSGCSPAGS